MLQKRCKSFYNNSFQKLEHNGKNQFSPCFSCLSNWLKILNSSILVPAFSINVSLAPKSLLVWCYMAPQSCQSDAGTWIFYQCRLPPKSLLMWCCMVPQFCHCDAGFCFFCGCDAGSLKFRVFISVVNLFLSVWCCLLNFIFISVMLAHELNFCQCAAGS